MYVCRIYVLLDIIKTYIDEALTFITEDMIQYYELKRNTFSKIFEPFLHKTFSPNTFSIKISSKNAETVFH